MAFCAFVFQLVFVSAIYAQDIGRGNTIPVIPDANKTPGEFCSEQDRDFLEHRYAEKMPYCERNVDQWQKNKIYKLYNIPANCRHRYTVDHLVPLAIGGNNAFENLWPEHVLVKKTRQELERQMYEKVKMGEMVSHEAVEIILKAKLELQLDLSHVEGCG